MFIVSAFEFYLAVTFLNVSLYSAHNTHTYAVAFMKLQLHEETISTASIITRKLIASYQCVSQ